MGITQPGPISGHCEQGLRRPTYLRWWCAAVYELSTKTTDSVVVAG
ncbi:MAG: hypothetical protein QOH50_825 [Kribbellaceae bacterium]|jgi:hypothetical protein|nr:hypothetical protein [Kribbellaceae bacterium]